MSTSKQKLIEDNMNLVYFVIHKHYPGFIKDEDVTQEGFYGLCRAVETYDECKGSFSAYASRAIINQIKSYFMRELKHKDVRSLDFELMEHKDGEVITLMDLIEDESINKDFNQIERDEFIETVDERDQLIIGYMKEGLNQTEVADILGISPQAVQQRVSRFRAKWRKVNGKY